MPELGVAVRYHLHSHPGKLCLSGCHSECLVAEGYWLCCLHHPGYHPDASGAKNGDSPQETRPQCYPSLRPGGQYASGEYVEKLKRHGFLVSMAAVGNVYENAAMESFFKTLKEGDLCEYETYQMW